MEPTTSTVKDPMPTAWAAIAALTVGCALDAYAFFYVKNVAGIAGVPPPPYPNIHFLVRTATLITFVMWLDRVYANLEGIGRETREYQRVWAAFGFVAPPFLFFRPCQIVMEVGRSSGGPALLKPLTVVWWAGLWVPPAIVVSMIGAPAEMRTSSVLLVHFVNAVNALLAVLIVSLITAAQRAEWQRCAFVEAAERRAKIAQAARLRMTEVAPETAMAPAPAEASKPAAVAVPVVVPGALPIAAPVSTAAPTAAVPSALPHVIPPRIVEPLPVRLRTPMPLLLVPTATWKTFAASVMAFMGLLTIVAGTVLVIGRTGVPSIGGILYLIAGTILACTWALLRRERLRGDTAEATRWRVIAAFGAGLALLNLVVLAGVLGE